MVALSILLLVLGLGLIIGEFFTGSHLLIGMGVIFIIIGVLFLSTPGLRPLQVNWWLVILILLVLAGTLTFAVSRIRKSYHHQVATGTEDLIGKTAMAKTGLDPEGTVLYMGELWRAISKSGKIQLGEEVIIKGVEGLTLTVEKK
jgi:membrane-bound serine protease (ClpP class)